MTTIPLSLIYAVAKDAGKLGSKYLKASEHSSKDAFQQHCIWAEGWSSLIQIFGMTKPMSIDRDSVSLSITDRPRSFIRHQLLPRMKYSTRKNLF